MLSKVFATYSNLRFEPFQEAKFKSIFFISKHFFFKIYWLFQKTNK